jgi:hypothetical protein
MMDKGLLGVVQSLDYIGICRPSNLQSARKPTRRERVSGPVSANLTPFLMHGLSLNFATTGGR